MGFVTRYIRKDTKPKLNKLPSGTFTVDAQCRIVSSTVPQGVPEAQVQEIGRQVLNIFQGAVKAQLQFSELTVQYESFRITAREMRGGAMIFMSPKTVQTVTNP